MARAASAGAAATGGGAAVAGRMKVGGRMERRWQGGATATGVERAVAGWSGGDRVERAVAGMERAATGWMKMGGDGSGGWCGRRWRREQRREREWQ